MEMRFSWDSPSTRLVLTAVLDTLAEHGYDSLTEEEIQLRAGPAARALGDPLDVEALLVAALEQVHVFAPVEPTAACGMTCGCCWPAGAARSATTSG